VNGRVTKPSTVLAMLAALASSPLGAEGDWPRDTRFDGPLRFCSYSFATDIPAGEVATVRDPGLDFTITYFESGDRWLGVYEGNHPQTNDKKIRRTRLFPDVRVDRMIDPAGATSYLVHALPGGASPVLVHIFSDQFVGSEADAAVLQRFSFGGVDKTGCSTLTYERA